MPYTSQRAVSDRKEAMNHVSAKPDGVLQSENTCSNALPRQNSPHVSEAMRHFNAREKATAWTEKIERLKAKLHKMKDLIDDSNERLDDLERMCDDMEQKMFDCQLTDHSGSQRLKR